MILLSAQTYLSFFVVVSLIAVFISSVRSYRATRRKLIQIKQKLESDISVAQMMQSEQRISEFLKTNRLQPGVSIQIIADKLNIVEGGVQEDLTDRAWLSGPNENGKMTVVFKKVLVKKTIILILLMSVDILLTETRPLPRVLKVITSRKRSNWLIIPARLC